MDNVIAAAVSMMGAAVAVVGFVGSVCSIVDHVDRRMAESRLRKRRNKMMRERSGD